MRGKALLTVLADTHSTDHPRTCGEKIYDSKYCIERMGSPPHMRGKESAGYSGTGLQRITPAHAGKRAFSIYDTPKSRDHPRTCGEKNQQDIQVQGYNGSPPHMRGKVRFVIQEIVKIRITPAHAGKSCFCLFR